MRQKRLVRLAFLGVLTSFLGFAGGRTNFVTYADEMFACDSNATCRAEGSNMTGGERSMLVSLFNFCSVGIRIVIILCRNTVTKYTNAPILWFIGSFLCMVMFGLTPVLFTELSVTGALIAAAVQKEFSQN